MIFSIGEEKSQRVLLEIVRDWNAENAGTTSISIFPVRLETSSGQLTADHIHAIINNPLLKDCHLLIGIFGNGIFTDASISVTLVEQLLSRFLQLQKPVTLYLPAYRVDPYKIIPAQLSDFKNFILKNQPGQSKRSFACGSFI